MGRTNYSMEEIASLGKEIYAKRLQPLLEPENTGKFLVIDIETRDYEMDENGEVASLRARDKKPDGVRYAMRIGHRAWGRIRFARLAPTNSATANW
jgi:hypothetical protein